MSSTMIQSPTPWHSGVSPPAATSVHVLVEEQAGQRLPLELVLSDLHYHDGDLVLGNRDPDRDPTWRSAGSVPVAELNSHMPKLRDYIMGPNVYVTPNTFDPTKSWLWRNSLTGRGTSRTNANVAWFHWCWCELDCYSPGKVRKPLTAADAHAAIDWLVRHGSVPEVSVYAYSGRGLYVLWRLTGEPGHAVRRTNDTYPLWRQVQRRLADCLSDFGPDSVAFAPSSVLRLPGSVNAKSGSVVRWLPVPGRNGTHVCYTLEQLAECLHVATPPTTVVVPMVPPPPVDRGCVEASVPPVQPRRSGAATAMGKAPHLARLRDLEVLGSRRGFHEGCRHDALKFAAFHADRLGRDPLSTAMRFNAAYCKPPLSDREVRDAAKFADRPRCPYMPRSDTIAAALGVTADIAREWKLDSIMPTGERQRREALVAERRQAKREAHDDLDQRVRDAYADATPSLRVLARELGVSRSSISRAKVRLGITKASKAGRPRLTTGSDPTAGTSSVEGVSHG